MTKDEALARMAQGKTAWNDWAQQMLKERKALESAGTWAAERSFTQNEWRLEGKNEQTQAWLNAADVDFSDHEFCENVSFAGFIFPSDVRFNKTTFSGDAEFREATFSGYAGFREATFSGHAWFIEATFSGDAGFREATFSGYAGFVQTIFAGYTIFTNSYFKKVAKFTALDVKSAFSLDGAKFEQVPDFIQAHFAEAPTLDSLHIQSGRFWRRKPPVNVENETACWRALKRIAIQAHDHDRELDYFAGELRARRGAEDPFWHIRNWFGWLYQFLSNFGRSVLLPLFWWALSTALFAWAYLAEHFTQQVANLAGMAYGLKPGTCDPVLSALLLSLRKGLLFAGFISSSKSDQTYACLYGIDKSLIGVLGKRVIVLIPDNIIFLGLLQTLVSAILLFLLLLALRNAFRIR